MAGLLTANNFIEIHFAQKKIQDRKYLPPQNFSTLSV